MTTKSKSLGEFWISLRNWHDPMNHIYLQIHVEMITPSLSLCRKDPKHPRKWIPDESFRPYAKYHFLPRQLNDPFNLELHLNTETSETF